MIATMQADPQKVFCTPATKLMTHHFFFSPGKMSKFRKRDRKKIPAKVRQAHASESEGICTTEEGRSQSVSLFTCKNDAHPQGDDDILGVPHCLLVD
jgi:hypothetical protein